MRPQSLFYSPQYIANQALRIISRSDIKRYGVFFVPEKLNRNLNPFLRPLVQSAN